LLQRRDRLGNKLLIQERSKTSPATYVVFDILMKNGKNLTNLPLNKRKKILDKTIINGNGLEKIFFVKDCKKLWKEITKRRLEGVVAKLEKSKYLSGIRNPAWIKIKHEKTIDCIIIGFTQGKRIISSLALGVYHKKKLIYIGKVGTGFGYTFLEDLYKQLKKIKIKKPPAFIAETKNIQWVKPQLVCEVKYLEITKDKKLRIPIFLRIRDDKKPRECTFKSQI
jgi:bifunctional non-homologous end joining protein LigD